MESRIDLSWFRDIGKRLATAGDIDGAVAIGQLVSFVETLVDQLVTDEQKRVAASRAIADSLTPFDAEFEWICHACGERRPDSYISVAHRQFTGPGERGTWRVNARYCNDRPDCLRKVPDWLDSFAAPAR